MGTGRSTKLLIKIPLLLVILLLSGLASSSCTGVGTIPKGWSGGVIADDTLFVGSREGELVAANTTDGSRLWAVPLEGSEAAGGGFGCAPASTSVAIYGTPAMAADLGLVYVDGYNGKIYAVNSSSGALRWVYPRDRSLQHIVGGPVVAEGRVYFSCSDGKVYALDAATGDDQWVFETGDKIWSTPAIDGDTLFIGSFDKKLYAIDTTTGKEKWEQPFETEGAIVSTPVVYDDTVYFGSFDRHLYAISITNGKQIWKFPANDEGESKPGNWFWAKPIAHNNVIYAPCLDGRVYILNAETGGEVADAIDLGGQISSSPVLVDNSIIVAKEDGIVYSLDTVTNQKRELVTLGEKVYAPLAASQGIIYIHTVEDALYAVDAQSGAIREFNIKS